MLIIRTVAEMQAFSEEMRLNRKKIAVVPTMGFLHDGHASLLRAARNDADVVILTIFVNPTQFAPTEDLSRYPRDFERDCAIAGESGVDVVFAPLDSTEIYPNGFESTIDVGSVAKPFEGAFRPTHFRGVATVVAKLFAITKPHIAYFGQKDYQQTCVIKRLVSDLNIDVKIVVCPTRRESDGLAMSSRNVYLQPIERERAATIWRALCAGKHLIESGELRSREITEAMSRVLAELHECKIDYATPAHAEYLHVPEIFSADEAIVLLIAVRFPSARLIDNEVVFPHK